MDYYPNGRVLLSLEKDKRRSLHDKNSCPRYAFPTLSLSFSTGRFKCSYTFFCSRFQKGRKKRAAVSDTSLKRHIVALLLCTYPTQTNNPSNQLTKTWARTRTIEEGGYRERGRSQKWKTQTLSHKRTEYVVGNACCFAENARCNCVQKRLFDPLKSTQFVPTHGWQ